MARVLVDKKWYEQIEPSTFSETEFEDQINLNAPIVYPEFIVIPFKQTVCSDEGNAKPDLIFISKDLCDWRVVEIEMGYHDFNNHVLPQVEILANATYSEEHVNYLYNRSNIKFDREKLTSIFTNQQPKVLVIVNEPEPNWVKPLQKRGATLAIFELFRGDDETELFRVNGEYPSLITRSISKCRFHPTIPRLLGVENPDNLSIPRHGFVKIRYNNCLTIWERIDAVDRVWLQPRNRNPLDSKNNYEIFCQLDGSLVIREG